MAPDYQLIQNENLRLLCQSSVSINFLPEEQRQNVINKIAGLTPEKQAQVADLLENEQKQIKESTAAPAADAQSAAPQSTEQQLQAIEAGENQLTAIEHEYDAKIRNIHEQAARTEDGTAAENLLTLLDKL